MSYPETNQEIFNICLTHLWNQNMPSRTEGPEPRPCMYRNTKGHKCAFGIFISDEDYSPDMEWKTIKLLLSSKSLPPTLEKWTEMHYNLLCALQVMHDTFDDCAYPFSTPNFHSYLLAKSTIIADFYKLDPFIPPKRGN